MLGVFYSTQTRTTTRIDLLRVSTRFTPLCEKSSITIS